MRIPISRIREGFDADWQLFCETAEESLLLDLYKSGRVEIDFKLAGIEEGCLIMELRRVEGVRPLIPRS